MQTRFSRRENLILPVPFTVIPPNCVIESIPMSRSYPSSSPSTTRACTATGGPSPMLMWTMLSPQHTSEPPRTVNTGTFFFSHALQHALCTRVWVHLVSTSAERLHPLIHTLTAGSTLFSSDFGKRLALRLPPLARFPDNSALCGLACHNGSNVFMSVLFGQVCPLYCSGFGSPLRSGWVHHICSILGPFLVVWVLPQPLRPVPCRLLRCSGLWLAIRPAQAH